jgi:homoserine O-acetyltransferase/O-succinyltransferase
MTRYHVAAALALLLMGGIPVAAQTSNPSAQPDTPASNPADAVYPNYRFRSGETSESLRFHYTTMGAPRRDKDGQIDNAVLVLHWTGGNGRQLMTPTFMKSLYAAGKPLDASRYYLIVPDSIGCGESSKPSDGLHARFPHYGYNDMVDLQHKLVTETLGITRLHAILGISMGGMNAWQWAEAYPDDVEGVMPVVSLPSRIAGRNAIWRYLATNMIEQDPAYKGGDYAGPFPGFIHAYQLLFMMIDGVPHLQATTPDWPAAARFLDNLDRQGETADANDLIYSLKSSADYDPEPGLDRIKAKLFALNFGDDEFNPDELGILQRLTPKVVHGRYVVQPGSATTFGHLTMTRPELWADHVATFMRELEGSTAKAGSADK